MNLSEDQQKRVEFIVQKSNTFHRQTQVLKTYIEGDSPDIINAKLRLNSLTTLYDNYVRYNDELISLKSDHPRLDEFPALESAYYDVATAVNKMTNTPEPIANSTFNSTNSNITNTKRVDLPKLPTIKLPVFNGNHDEWFSFKNKFIALVHSRSNISGFVKYTQLESALSGSALGKLAEFHASDINYPKAWKALCDAYDQKHLIVTEHLDALLDLPVLSKAIPNDLSMLIDKTRQHLNMLEQVQVKVNEDIIIRILERCLPPGVLSRWQDKLEGDKLPTLDEFYKFIQSTVFKLRSLERASTTNHNNARKRTGDKTDRTSQGKFPKTEARSLATTHSNAVNASNSPNSFKFTCRKCNGEHNLYKCSEFNNLKVQERWDFVKINKLCRNCLSSHPLPCKSNNRCKKCDRDHHTSLHAERKVRSIKDQGRNQNSTFQGAQVTNPLNQTQP